MFKNTVLASVSVAAMIMFAGCTAEDLVDELSDGATMCRSSTPVYACIDDSLSCSDYYDQYYSTYYYYTGYSSMEACQSALYYAPSKNVENVEQTELVGVSSPE